MLVFH